MQRNHFAPLYPVVRLVLDLDRISSAVACYFRGWNMGFSVEQHALSEQEKGTTYTCLRRVHTADFC